MNFFNKLQNRIIFAFVFLFVIVNLTTLLVGHYYISKIMDRHLSEQTDRISQVLSNSKFVLNQFYISRLKEVIESDIIVFDKTGQKIVSTLSEADFQKLEKELDGNHLYGSLDQRPEKVVRKRVWIDEAQFLLTFRSLRISAQPEKKRVLGTLASLDDFLNAKATITNWMIIIGAGELFLALLAAYIIPRSLTQPIKDLVTVTEDIAEGKFGKKALLPTVEELHRLTLSINVMSDKLKDYEKQLIQSTQLAAVGQVTAAMAHEIGNPLSSIKMMTQLLRDRAAEDMAVQKIVKPLLEEIGRLERIVKDLSSPFRTLKLSPEKADINALIAEIATVIAPKIEHRKIHLEENLEENLPKITIDRDKIKQVIWNLLLNAMESMPQGGILKISTLNNPQEKNIRVLIEDQGQGIKSVPMEKIFDYFYTTKSEGMGLGLSTSKNVIEYHGGRLTVENINSGGVRATITLPLDL